MKVRNAATQANGELRKDPYGGLRQTVHSRKVNIDFGSELALMR
jgi:hypothetical protein